MECVHLKSPAGIVHKHIKDITDWCNTSEAAPPGPVSSESSSDNLQILIIFACFFFFLAPFQSSEAVKGISLCLHLPAPNYPKYYRLS